MSSTNGKQQAAGQQMGIASPSRLLLRDFRQMPELHFLRELVHNSLQAGAHNITVSPDWLRREKGGALKLLVSDDGRGMTAEQLVKYFNNLASSGGTWEGDEKYGVGAKGACWPWNRGGQEVDTGIQVLSWTADGPAHGASILLGQNSKGEPALMTQYDPTNEEYAQVVPAPAGYREYFLPKGAKSGTVVILLGRETHQNTYFGPVARSIKDIQLKAFVQHLNSRYFQLPKEVKLKVFEFASFDGVRVKEEPKGMADGGGLRPVHGAKYYLDQKETLFTGEVRLQDGSLVTLYALKHPKEGQSRNEVGNEFRPKQVSVRYDDELYVVNLAGKDTWPLYRAFGFGYPGGMRDVTIIVEPPKARLDAQGRMTKGVYPTDARTKLLYSNGEGSPAGELPWEEWGRETVAKMPANFRSIIESAQAQRLANIEASTQEDILRDANVLLRDFGLRLHKYGKQRLRSADVPGGAPRADLQIVEPVGSDEGGVRVLVPKEPPEAVEKEPSKDPDGEGDRQFGTEENQEKGKAAVRVRDASRYIPIIRHSSSEELDALLDGLPCDFTDVDNVLTVNDRSKFITDLVAVLRKEFEDHPNTMERDVLIDAEVRRGIERTLALGVVHARALRANPVWARHWEGLVSREALAQKLLGSPDFVSRVRRVIAGALGSSAASAAVREVANG